MDQQTRRLVEKKKEQIKRYEADRELPKEERTFEPKVYDTMIKDLEQDIKQLETKPKK